MIEVTESLNRFFIDKEKNRLLKFPHRILDVFERHARTDVDYYDRYRTFFLKAGVGITVAGGVMQVFTGVPFAILAIPTILQGIYLETSRAGSVHTLYAVWELRAERDL